jgi:hypothetical protein
MFEKLVAIVGMAAALLVGGCNQKPPDPNVIETKLADGRVLHYSKQELDEAKSWGMTKPVYDSELATGHTHGELIESAREYYRVHARSVGYPIPAGDITPPPGMRVK